MPAVPYNPVPTVEPSERGAPSISVATPVAAFGGATAAATTGLGDQTQAVGTELFTRALAMQQLTNETNAKNANVDFMLKAGDLHAKYNALQGQDRVAAYGDYSKNLQALYKSTRDSLGNPMAQQMFDGAAISTLNRSIFSAAGAAATAQREAAQSSAISTQAVLEKSVYDSNDPSGLESAKDQIRNNAPGLAATMPGGATPEKVTQLTQDGVSRLNRNYILGIVRTDPTKAAGLMEKYKDEMTAPDYLAVESKVQSLVHTVGVNQVAQTVLQSHLNDDKTFSESADTMVDEAVGQAEKLYPNDPAIAEATQKQVRALYNQHTWEQLQQTRQVNQQVADYITKGVTNVNMLPPELVKQMTPQQLKQFPGQANSYQMAVTKQTDTEVSTKLQGLYQNDNDKFMSTDILSMDGLSRGSKDYFLKLQRNETSQGDPRVSRAMNWLRGAVPSTLQSLDLYKRSTANADNFDKFTGTLHDAIQAWQEANGKAPSEKDVSDTIFPNVVKQISTPGWLFGTNQTPFYQADVPDKVKAQIIQARPNATDEQVRHIYNRAVFDQFYGSQSITKTQDRVGK